MKILVVNTGYFAVPPKTTGPLISGSIELHTYYLANELARLGNDVHYITSVNKNALFLNGVTLHRLIDLPLAYKASYPEMSIHFAIGGSLAFKEALRTIKQDHFDVVHGHGNICSALLLPLKKKSRYVFTVHNRTPWMISSSMLMHAFRKLAFLILDLRVIKNADRVITVSENLKKEIIGRFGVDSNKVRLIPNGVDLKLFKPSISDFASLRSKYGIDYEYALFVGRLVEEKAVDIILKAIVGTRLHLVIVGDGPLLQFLKDLSVHLGVGHQVHFIGPVCRSELHKFYSQATLSVLPSSTEVGSPLAGLEAMASGLPIIATCASRISGIVKHGYNGFIIDPRNIQQLREKVIQLFEDASLRKVMGERSRKIVETQYSWEQIAKETFHVYEEIV